MCLIMERCTKHTRERQKAMALPSGWEARVQPLIHQSPQTPPGETEATPSPGHPASTSSSWAREWATGSSVLIPKQHPSCSLAEMLI